jgi:hypothetical protein
MTQATDRTTLLVAMNPIADGSMVERARSLAQSDHRGYTRF